MKVLRNALVMGLAATTALTMMGCGNSAEPSAKKGEKIIVSFQTWNLKNDTYSPYFEKLAKEFEKDNPGVTVKWMDQPGADYDAKLSTQAAAGQLPDVVNVSETQGYNLAKSGALLNLSQDETAKQFEKDYLPQVWEGSTFQGNGIDKGVYGFPWYMNIDVAYINTDVYKACGLDPENPPKTYDDYFEQGKTLTKNCKDKYYFIAVPWIQPSMFNEYGSKFLNSDHSKYTFNDAKGVEFITAYKDLYANGGFPKEGLNANITTAEKLYFQGNVAYMLDSTSSVMSFKMNAPDLYKKLKVVPLVTNTKNTLNQFTMAVSSQTKHKEVAVKLAHFLTNAKNQLEFSKKSNTFPSATESFNDEYFSNIDTSTLEGQVREVAKQEIENGTIANFPPEVSDSDGATYLSPYLVKAIQGDMGVKEALDAAVEAMNGRLKS